MMHSRAFQIQKFNGVSKGRSPDFLGVVMVATYKVDFVTALKHLARTKGIPTSLDDLTPAVRTKRTKVPNNSKN